MNLLAELKRRNVIRVAIGYLAVSWLVLQAGSLIFAAFDLPNSWVRTLLAILAIGFLPVLAFSWLYELTPQGLKRTSDVPEAQSVAHLTGRRLDFVVIGVLAAIVALLLVDRFVVTPRQAGTAPAPVSTAMGAANNPVEKPDQDSGNGSPTLGAASTAVLPFVNMSADKANEYFSDGMTETLLNRLAQVPQLKVAARTSSFSFKGTNADMRKIGTALGVASLVEGSVQQAGDTLRITAQLIRAVDGAHLWSHSYDRRAADLFAIQDEIANAVTEALVGQLLPQTRALLAKGGTKDLGAYDSYTRGLERIAANSFGSNQEAEAMMRQALARDPDYVDAMAGLVMSFMTMYRTGQIRPSEFQARAEPILARIEAIDPDNGMALVARAQIAQDHGEHDSAIAFARRAVAAAPSDARVHVYAATIYLLQGDLQAWMGELDQAVALNPLDNNVIRFRATGLRLTGHLDEGRAAALRALEIDPNNSSNYWELCINDQARGNLVDAIVHCRRSDVLDPADPESGAVLASLLAEIGEFDAAKAWTAESSSRYPRNLLAASADVQTLFQRGDAQATVEMALPLAGRGADDHHDFWRFAMVDACLAANDIGRAAEMRAALVAARALPADFSADAFATWKGDKASAVVSLRRIAALRECAFTAGVEDAPRRDALRSLLAAAVGSGWETVEEWRPLASELRNDRDALLALALPPQQVSVADLAIRSGNARRLGIGDDTRLKAHLDDQRKEIERQRSALPAALAKDHQTLLPSPER